MRLSRVPPRHQRPCHRRQRLRLLVRGLVMERATAAAWDATVAACSCWPALASCRQAQILGSRRVGKSPSVRLS
jgi:hypothetical protein